MPDTKTRVFFKFWYLDSFSTNGFWKSTLQNFPRSGKLHIVFSKTLPSTKICIKSKLLHKMLATKKTEQENSFDLNTS